LNIENNDKENDQLTDNTNININTNTNSDNSNNFDPTLSPVELLNNIKGFKHKVELKKYKKKIKEELSS
jgi:hypothetical protein